MRVCLLSFEYPPRAGGEGTYTKNLAVGLAKQGHDVTIVAPAAKEPHWEEEKEVRVMRVRAGGRPIREAGFLAAAERLLKKLAGERRIDLVHVTFDFPTSVFDLRGIGVPCLATVHHLQIAEAMSRLPYTKAIGRPLMLLRGSILSRLEARVLNQCAGLIAVSGYTAATLGKYLSVRSDKVHVIRNGIDPARFEGGDGEVFRHAFPQLKPKCVLFVGRVHPSKGLEYLIDGFARAHSLESRASLAIVGTGDVRYTRSLAARAGSLGLSGDVVFTGKVPDWLLPHAYAASSFTVLPSFMEGSGLSVLESFASGRACVATRAGALPELVTEGENGLLVRVGDAEGLGKAILRLLGDSELAASMGERGKGLVRSDLNLEKMTRETSDVYRELM